MEEELDKAELSREDFLQNEVPGMIWREEQRDVFIKPRDIKDVVIAPDEMNDGRVKAKLSFSLPRGAYATLMIKRLFAPSWYGGNERYGDRRWEEQR